MASPWALTRPPVLAVADGIVQVWLRRETIDDVLRLDPRAPRPVPSPTR